MTMPAPAPLVPHPNIEIAVTNALKRIPRGDMARVNRSARLKGYADYESMLRAEATQRVSGQVAQNVAAVQPGPYAEGGPLATSRSLAPTALPGAAPDTMGMLPPVGGTNATQQMAAQKLSASAAGNPLPTRATQMLPELSPSSVAAKADSALIDGLGGVNPGDFATGGPLAPMDLMATGAREQWLNNLKANFGGTSAMPAIEAAHAPAIAAERAAAMRLPTTTQPAMLNPAPFGPDVPSLASTAPQRLSLAAEGTSGAAPIAASAPSIAAEVAPLAGAAPALAHVAPEVAGGGAIARTLGLSSAGGEGLLGGMGMARFGIQAAGGAMAGGAAGGLADKLNVGGHNSIADQFVTGAVGGGIGGGIAGLGTGPGALVTGLAGAAVGGVGNVLLNQLGVIGPKHNKGVQTNGVDLAASQLFNQAEKYGITGDVQQALVQSLRANSDAYAKTGGGKLLATDMSKALAQLPAMAQQQAADRQRMAYDNKFRDQALQSLQPKIDMMNRQYGLLADLYEQRGDPTFAASLRANAAQQAAQMQAQITTIPQQVALENARSFAAQLNQARTSQQIGQMVNPTSNAGGGLLSIANG